MPLWSDSTVVKLRSSVFTMLAEAGYVKDSRSLLLQNVFLDDQLAAYLRENGESLCAPMYGGYPVSMTLDERLTDFSL